MQTWTMLPPQHAAQWLKCCYMSACLVESGMSVSKVKHVGTCDNSAGKYPLASQRMSMEVGHPSFFL